MVRPLDAVLAKFITDFLTMFVIGVMLYTGIILYYALPVTLDLAAIFNGFLLMGLLGLGFGTLNCVIFWFWPTWRQIWSVLTKPLFILSGMFYTFESLPPQAQAVVWYNPLIHAVGLMRRASTPATTGSTSRPLYVLGIAAAASWSEPICCGATAARCSSGKGRHRYRGSPVIPIRACHTASRSTAAGTANSVIRPKVDPSAANFLTEW